jgi:uncharacterized protein YbaA (DUF1428 family)
LSCSSQTSNSRLLRDAAHAKMVEWMNDPVKADPRMDPEKNPMPFDGKRLIFRGFIPLVDLQSK